MCCRDLQGEYLLCPKLSLWKSRRLCSTCVADMLLGHNLHRLHSLWSSHRRKGSFPTAQPMQQYVLLHLSSTKSMRRRCHSQDASNFRCMAPHHCSKGRPDLQLPPAAYTFHQLLGVWWRLMTRFPQIRWRNRSCISASHRLLQQLTGVVQQHPTLQQRLSCLPLIELQYDNTLAVTALYGRSTRKSPRMSVIQIFAGQLLLEPSFDSLCWTMGHELGHGIARHVEEQQSWRDLISCTVVVRLVIGRLIARSMPSFRSFALAADLW